MVDGRQTLCHFIRGRFQYRLHEAWLPFTFWRVLTYDPQERSISIGPEVSPEDVAILAVMNPRPSATGEYWG